MHTEKLFTVEEANALVPRLSMLVGRLQQGAIRLGEQMQDIAAAEGVDVAALTTAEIVRRFPQASGVIEELDELLHEIERSGATLKDMQLGLVDFPAERGGERVLLCWQFGEPEVAYWHHVSDGFGGRKPLPTGGRPPQLQ
ncbi:MAG: DUF2203 domain-containing protein [Candidatus Binatia bacterium]